MNYLLWNLFGPASWPLWLVFVAAAALLGRTLSGELLARRAVLLAAALVLVMGVLPTGFWLMQRLEAAYPRSDGPATTVRHIVVLAGGESLGASAHSGRLEINSHGDRISSALILARQYPSAQLWVVGGVGLAAGEPRDVDWVTGYWSDAGIADRRIHKIEGTFDTCANARGIAREVPREGVLLVTSGFHLPRAMACLRAAGVNADPYPVDSQIWAARGIADAFSPDLAANIRRTDLALHEMIGLLYYRLSGRL